MKPKKCPDNVDILQLYTDIFLRYRYMDHGYGKQTMIVLWYPARMSDIGAR